MTPTHEKLLGMVSRLKLDPDLQLRMLGRWVEESHCIEPDSGGWRITTADDKDKWFSGSAVAEALAKYAP